jgi:hypothetical protein
MRYLKPRITLGILLVASVVGVYLAWLPTSVSAVVPGVSWLAIVALGVVLGSSLLRSIAVARVDGVSARTVSDRWDLLDRAALGAAIVGTGLRLLAVPRSPTTGSSLLLLLAGAGLLTAPATWSGRIPVGVGGRRREARMLAGAATLGFVGIAWVDVSMQGGATADVLVRTLHLWAVGLWIGAATWHNAVVVHALRRDALPAVRPVVRRFQRGVPVIVLAVLVTGFYQATTWLGTRPAAYTTTAAGRLVALKLLSLVVIAGFIGITHLRTPVTDAER